MNYKLKQKFGIILLTLCCAGCSSAKDPVLTGSFLPNRDGSSGAVAEYPVEKKEKVAIAEEVAPPKEVTIAAKTTITPEPKKEEAVVEVEKKPVVAKTSTAGLGIISQVDDRAVLNESPQSASVAGVVGDSGKSVPLEKSKAGMQWFDADASENKSAFLSDTVDNRSADKIQSGRDTNRKSDAGLGYLQADADETFIVYISKTMGIVPADK